MGIATREYRLTRAITPEDIARRFEERTGLACRLENVRHSLPMAEIPGATDRMSLVCDTLADSVQVTLSRDTCALVVGMRFHKTLTYFPDQIDLSIEELGAHAIDSDAHIAARRAEVETRPWRELPPFSRWVRQPPVATITTVCLWLPVVLINLVFAIPFVLLVLAMAMVTQLTSVTVRGRRRRR